MKLSSTIPNSVSADYIVTEVLSDTYDDAGILKEKMYRWLYRVWSLLNFSLIRTPRTAILPIAPGTKTMWLPVDYQDFLFLGFPDNCSNWLPISVNRNLMPQYGIEGADICETCGQPDLCSLDIEQTTETVNMDGTDYIKTTSRVIRADGSYTEEVEQPVKNYETGEVDMQTTHRVITQLDKSCTTCVPATPGNLNILSGCGCMAALCCCSTELLPADSKPSNVQYNLYEQEGFIQFNSSCCIDRAILKYVTTGKCINGVYYFPLRTMEYLIAATYYKSIEKKKNIPQVEKDRARKAATAEKKDMFRDFTKLSYQEWLELVDMVPRLPAIDSTPTEFYGGQIFPTRRLGGPSVMPEVEIKQPDLKSMVVMVPVDTTKLQVPGMGIFSSVIIGNTSYDINSVTQSGQVLDFSLVGTLPKGMRITIYHTK